METLVHRSLTFKNSVVSLELILSNGHHALRTLMAITAVPVCTIHTHTHTTLNHAHSHTHKHTFLLDVSREDLSGKGRDLLLA